MKVARVEHNVVMEIIPEYGLPVEKWYGKEFAKLCYEIPDEIECGWYFNTETKECGHYDPSKLPEVKNNKITESKASLENFIKDNPLVWTDGKTYSVTQEKQTLLANELMEYVCAPADAKPVLKWNASGEVETEWGYDNLIALQSAISNYIEPLVSYQRRYEEKIKAAKLTEEIVDEYPDYHSVVKKESK